MTSFAAKFAHPAPHFPTPRLVRSLAEFGAMAGRAYSTGTAYRSARDPQSRQRVLDSFLAELHRSA